MKRIIPLLLTLALTGCHSVKVVRTVAVPGLPPVAIAARDTVADGGLAFGRPYQIVGKMTVYRKSGNVTAKLGRQRMKEAAAAMGADAVIGVQERISLETLGTIYHSGLAVKWLSPGESQRPMATPFMIAQLPLAPDPDAKGDQVKTAKAVNQAATETLEKKGYYVLPGYTVSYRGGLEGVKGLPEAEIAALGGDTAQLLLEFDFLDRSQANIIIGAGASAGMKATMMNKATREVVYQKDGQGGGYSGWLINLIDSNAKRAMAAAGAARSALRDVKPVGEEVRK